jgi:hypothetical protein
VGALLIHNIKHVKQIRYMMTVRGNHIIAHSFYVIYAKKNILSYIYKVLIFFS